MKRNALVYFIGTNIHRLFIFITADSNNNSNNNNTENDRTIIIFVEKSKHEFELAHNFIQPTPCHFFTRAITFICTHVFWTYGSIVSEKIISNSLHSGWVEQLECCCTWFGLRAKPLSARFCSLRHFHVSCNCFATLFSISPKYWQSNNNKKNNNNTKKKH